MLPGEIRRPAPAGLAHRRPCRWVAHQPDKGLSQGRRVLRRDEQPLLTGLQHEAVARNVGRDHGFAGGHGLDEHVTEGLVARRGGAADVSRMVVAAQVLQRYVADEMHIRQAACPRELLERRCFLGLKAADNKQPHFRAGPLHLLVCLQQVLEALALVQPADEQDVRPPIVELRPWRLRCGEERVVNTVRDDPVLTREETRDILARLLTDSDAAIQPVHERPESDRRLVKAETGVAIGVKGAYIDRSRLQQRPEGYGGRQRLMQVDDLEVLPAQDRTDAPISSGREADVGGAATVADRDRARRGIDEQFRRVLRV